MVGRTSQLSSRQTNDGLTALFAVIDLLKSEAGLEKVTRGLKAQLEDISTQRSDLTRRATAAAERDKLLVAREGEAQRAEIGMKAKYEQALYKSNQLARVEERLEKSRDEFNEYKSEATKHMAAVVAKAEAEHRDIRGARKQLDAELSATRTAKARHEAAEAKALEARENYESRSADMRKVLA